MQVNLIHICLEKEVDLPGYAGAQSRHIPKGKRTVESSMIGMETKLGKRTVRHLDFVDFHPGKNRSAIDNFFHLFSLL